MAIENPLVKCDLSALLAHVNILEECAVALMSLFLDGGAELQ